MLETAATLRAPATFVPIQSRGRLRSPLAPPSPLRALSAPQLAAIRAAMQLFVDDDLARGMGPEQRLFCDACERVRPAAGCIQYDRYLLCNGCGIEYEVAHTRGIVASPGQYVRDKRFGETKPYLLEEV